MLRGFDTDTVLTESIIVAAIAADMGRFGRYLKNLTIGEVALCAKHGAALWLIAEGEGDLSTMEQGTPRGRSDGVAAAAQTIKLGGVPESVPIFAAVDFGAVGMTQIDDIVAYMVGFEEGCAPNALGVYGDGDVLMSLPSAKGYVAGADGWPGTAALLANPPANIALVQHTTVTMFGINIDPADILDESVLWYPITVAQVPEPSTPLPASKRALQAALNEAGASLQVDGIWGALSEAALAAYLARLP